MTTSALSTDLYELTMVAGYYAGGVTGQTTFELYARDLPANRSLLIAAGLDQALHYLEHLRFTAEEIEYLRQLPNLRGVPAEFFDRYLREFRFTGEVWAIEEGTPVFQLEPLLRVTAPAAEAQLAETALLAIVTFQTSIASKAARVVEAAGGRPVIEYGSRRAHGTEAALYAARAAVVGGCDGTSNVEAGFRFGIPVSGTMAHSWVMTYADEVEAFRRYAAVFGERAVFLIDTYNTLEAARKIVASGLRPAAVRLDSGDLVTLSRAVRQILDEGGLRETKILASGDLDERRIAQLLAAGAPVDAFGVGGALSTSSDAPNLGGIYKLVEVERGGVLAPALKFSPGKRSYPGRKQVWRVYEDGVAARDVIGLSDEPGPAGATPLLARVMSGGRRERESEPVATLRTRSRGSVAEFPPAVRRLTEPERYPVTTSEALRVLTERLAGKITGESGQRIRGR